MMSDRAGQLLLSKLSPPSQESLLIDRARLNQKLDRTAPRKLLLLSAPAGYGKTSLLAQWYRARGAASRTGWISLDRADNNLFRMLQYHSGGDPYFSTGIRRSRAGPDALWHRNSRRGARRDIPE